MLSLLKSSFIVHHNSTQKHQLGSSILSTFEKQEVSHPLGDDEVELVDGQFSLLEPTLDQLDHSVQVILSNNIHCLKKNCNYLPANLRQSYLIKFSLPYHVLLFHKMIYHIFT